MYPVKYSVCRCACSNCIIMYVAVSWWLEFFPIAHTVWALCVYMCVVSAHLRWYRRLQHSGSAVQLWSGFRQQHQRLPGLEEFLHAHESAAEHRAIPAASQARVAATAASSHAARGGEAEPAERWTTGGGAAADAGGAEQQARANRDRHHGRAQQGHDGGWRVDARVWRHSSDQHVNDWEVLLIGLHVRYILNISRQT